MALGAEVRGDAGGGFQFELVALAVIEGERVAGVAFAAGQRQAGGGIQAAAQQADGFGGGAALISSYIIIAAMRMRFLTSTPLDIRRGSGTYVGIAVLARALERSATRWRFETPRCACRSTRPSGCCSTAGCGRRTISI